jgi:glycosyltransferase involved in cell wall biosynthesis
MAERASTAVASVDVRSFPLQSAKLRAVGHGIDLDEFPCTSPRREAGLHLLALGRYSPAKGLDVVLRAVAEVDDGVQLDVFGPTLSDEERDHRAELERLAAALGLDARVTLGEAVPRSDVPALLAGHDALVNNMRAGAPDKVVYEAAASCVPVLASNPVFDSLLEPDLRFAQGAPDELAQRIRRLGALGPDERRALGRRLRGRVEAGHSVQAWARGILDAAGVET